MVDVLARTGWHLSLKYPDDSLIIDPILQQGSLSNQKILSGENVFSEPTNISHSALDAVWHRYGTAWTLKSLEQRFAIGLLGVHAIIAIVHSLIVVIRHNSMEAWDSINELVLLAWNSDPTRRGHELKNCAGGIRQMRTLRNRVKIVALDDGTGNDRRVELVMVDDKGVNVDGRDTKRIEPEKKYS